MIEALRSAFVQLGRALREGTNDAKRAWNPWASAVVGILVVAVLVPLVVSDPIRLAALASGLYTILAAVGVNFAAGMAGIPSLGHGAFVAVGAFGAVLLRASAGWDPTVATVAAVLLGGLGGAVVAAGAVRLTRPLVAIASWVVSWLVAFTLAAFPGVFGGLQGVAVPEGSLGIAPLRMTVNLTPGVHYEIGLLLVATALAAYVVMSRAPWGLALKAGSERPAPASALGVEQGRLQFWTFTGSGLVCSAAGALSVQLAGVADPTAYGPLLSVELFAAVLLGGVGRPLGPVVGAAALLIIPRAAEGLGTIAGLPAERFEPAVASVLLVGALVIGRGGILGWIGLGANRFRRQRAASESAPVSAASSEQPQIPWQPALERWQDVVKRRPLRDGQTERSAASQLLEATGLQKRFGGVVALHDLHLRLGESEIRGLIGPNGSGKTTLLRVLGGTVAPDEGRILLAGHDITGDPTAGRVRAGLVRTLQRLDVIPTLSVRDNVVIGATARRRYGGGLRSLALTPQVRGETKTVAAEADALLSMIGLEHAADRYPSELSGSDQRFLMLAAACASFPRLLLLDEPSAGMSRPELQRLVALIRTLRSRGVTIVLVEHNLRLVRLLADRVTVMDAGSVIAEGAPEEIAHDPEVVHAYLGPQGM